MNIIKIAKHIWEGEDHPLVELAGLYLILNWKQTKNTLLDPLESDGKWDEGFAFSRPHNFCRHTRLAGIAKKIVKIFTTTIAFKKTGFMKLGNRQKKQFKRMDANERAIKVNKKIK